MARVLAEARGEKRGDTTDWCLCFKAGWGRRLREAEGSLFPPPTEQTIEHEDPMLNPMEDEQIELEWKKGRKNQENAEQEEKKGKKKKKSTWRINDGIEDDEFYSGPPEQSLEAELWMNITEAKKKKKNRNDYDGPGECSLSPEERHFQAGRRTLMSRTEVKDVVMVRNCLLDESPREMNGQRRRRDREASEASAGSLLPVVPSPSPEQQQQQLPPQRRFLAGTDRVCVGKGLGMLSVTSSPLASGWDDRYDEPVVVAGDVTDFEVRDRVGLISFTSLPVCIAGKLCGGDALLADNGVVLDGTLLEDGRKGRFSERIGMWTILFPPQLVYPTYCVQTVAGEWIRLQHPSDLYSGIMSDVRLLGTFLNFVRIYPHSPPHDVELFLEERCSSQPFHDLSIHHLPVIRSYAINDEQFKIATVWRDIFPDLFARKKLKNRDSDTWQHAPDSAVNKRCKYEQDIEAPAPKTEFIDLGSDSENLSDGRPPRGTEDEWREDPSEKGSDTDGEHEDPAICSFCDEGGHLLFCEGPCRRHFHPTKKSGQDSFCRSLNLKNSALKAMGAFYCRNCLYEQQQCFACGELGSTVSSGYGLRLVRKCGLRSCSRFFHEDCVNMVRFHTAGVSVQQCPRHFCSVCGLQEDEPGALVQCRRCPKAWHRQCLQNFPVSEEMPTRPIWTQTGRSYIYCRKHEVIGDLQTPPRNHILFPDVY